MAKKKNTMKEFGVGKRVSYDSKEFYVRELYSDKKRMESTDYTENSVPSDALDLIICHDSRDMHHLPDCSIHL